MFVANWKIEYDLWILSNVTIFNRAWTWVCNEALSIKVFEGLDVERYRGFGKLKLNLSPMYFPVNENTLEHGKIWTFSELNGYSNYTRRDKGEFNREFRVLGLNLSRTIYIKIEIQMVFELTQLVSIFYESIFFN